MYIHVYVLVSGYAFVFACTCARVIIVRTKAPAAHDANERLEVDVGCVDVHCRHAQPEPKT